MTIKQLEIIVDGGKAGWLELFFDGSPRILASVTLPLQLRRRHFEGGPKSLLKQIATFVAPRCGPQTKIRFSEAFGPRNMQPLENLIEAYLAEERTSAGHLKTKVRSINHSKEISRPNAANKVPLEVALEEAALNQERRSGMLLRRAVAQQRRRKAHLSRQ